MSNPLTLGKGFLFVFLTWAVVAGRFFIPTRLNFSYSGTYEALAHIWIGFMIGTAYCLPEHRRAIAALVVVISLLELVLVLIAKG